MDHQGILAATIGQWLFDHRHRGFGGNEPHNNARFICEKRDTQARDGCACSIQRVELKGHGHGRLCPDLSELPPGIAYWLRQTGKEPGQWLLGRHRADDLVLPRSWAEHEVDRGGCRRHDDQPFRPRPTASFRNCGSVRFHPSPRFTLHGSRCPIRHLESGIRHPPPVTSLPTARPPRGRRG